jgi:hypothetical protein
MDDNRLEAFVYPTWSNPPRLIGDLNTPHGDNSQVFSPTTGWPSINVPMGYTRGTLPIGMTILRARVERADADQVRLRLRAGHASPAPAADDAAAALTPLCSRGVDMIGFYRGDRIDLLRWKRPGASFRTVRKNTLAIAEEIPEDKYGFRAVPK